MSNLAFNDYRHNAIKQLFDSRIFRVINAKRIEEALTFFELLHGTSYKDNETKFIVLGNAYTQKGKKTLGWEQWGFKTSDINWNFMSGFLTLENCYMTVNNFIKPVRTSDKCFQLTSFYVDLDYYKKDKYKDKTPEELISIMRKKGLFKDLEPSFFVDSGNGMYIYYLIDGTLNGQLDNLKYVWSQTEAKLLKRFEEFGADTQVSDVSRVLRVPGSINPKTGRTAKLIYNTNKDSYKYDVFKEARRYKLKEVTDVLLDKNKNTKSKSKSERATYKGAIVLNWSINVATNRCKDIEKLVKLRGNCEGTRDIICLIYRQSLLHRNFTEEDSLEKTINLAYKMQDFGYKGFDEKYIARATEPTVRYYNNFKQAQKDYKDSDKSVSFSEFVKDRQCMLWTNAKIIQKLDVTQAEMEDMITLFNRKERSRREKENYNPSVRKEKYKKSLEKKGKMTKQQEIEICKKKMKDLLAEGLSSSEIMQVLNLKKPTFYRYKKQIEN